ncbi:MAG: hypothetical protein ACTSXD_08380 [Candidatus Heimdallarchaeaceae archaeon]
MDYFTCVHCGTTVSENYFIPDQFEVEEIDIRTHQVFKSYFLESEKIPFHEYLENTICPKCEYMTKFISANEKESLKAFKSRGDKMTEIKLNPKIPIGTYSARVVEVSDIYEGKKFDSEEKEEKMIIYFNIDNNRIPYFMKNFVSSRSKLGRLLMTAGLSQNIPLDEENKISNDKFIQFLKERLIGMEFKVLTKLSKKGQPDEYTVIGDVLEYIPK